MENLVIKSLLTEYENKRRYAYRELEERKTALYLLSPELEKIENEISHIRLQNSISNLQATPA